MGKTINITGNKYGHLLVLEKTNQKSGTNYLWKCQCDCDAQTVTYATKYALESGHKKSCGCVHTSQRSSLGCSKAKNLTGELFGKLRVKEKTDRRSDGRVMWRCECACGNEVYVKSSDLTQGRKTHCGCDIVFSKGEQKIANLLTEYGLKFEREKSFEDLRDERKLRYDFYVEDLYLIEYDGKQHFIQDSGYGADLVNIQKRDQLKNDYAKEHGIPLIRINFQRYDDFNVEDLIPDQYKTVLLKKGGES